MRSDPRLAKDEFPVWEGRPDPAAHFTAVDFYFVPFGVAWLAFAVFWTFAVGRQPDGQIAWVLGPLFIVFGVHLVFGRFFVKASAKRRTSYVLTNQRAIVIGPSATTTVALDVETVVRAVRDDRSHIDVVFGSEVGPMAGLPMVTNLQRYANTGLDVFAAGGPGLPIAFYDVADVDGLESALDSLIAVE